MAGPNRWGRGSYSMPTDNTTVYNSRAEALPEIVDTRRQRIMDTINEAKAKKAYNIRSGRNPSANSQDVLEAWSVPIAQQMWDDWRFQREEEEYKRQRDQELANEVLYDTDILDQNTRNINNANNQFTATSQIPAYMRYANPKDVNNAVYGNSPLASGIKGAYNATIGTLTDPEYGIAATYDKIRNGELDGWGAARNIGLNILALSPFIGGLSLSSAKGAGTAIDEAGNAVTRSLNNAATNVRNAATNVRNTISTLGNNARQMLYGSPEVQLALPGGGTMTVPISEAAPIARTITAPIARTAPISLEYSAINGLTKALNGVVSNAPYSVVANGLYNNARIMADEAPVANERAASETPTSETSAVEQPQESQEQPIPEQPQQNPEPEQPTPEQPQENSNQPQQNTRQPTSEEAKWQQAKEMDSYNGYVDFARDNPNSPYFKQAITLIKDKNPKGFLGRPKKLPDFIRKYEAEQNKIAANSGNATAAKEYKWWLGGDWHANKSFGQFIHNYVSPFNASGLWKQGVIFPAGEFLLDSAYNKMFDSTGTHLLKYGTVPALGFQLFNWLAPGMKRTLNITDVNKSPKDTTESIIQEPVLTRNDSTQKQTSELTNTISNSSQELDADDKAIMGGI